jgi:transcriptional regulator with XRE-family HTH domain
MNLAEIQSLKQIGRRLRNEREARGLTLSNIASSCGLKIQELVRVENGELMGFKQIPTDALKNAEIYANTLHIELGSEDTKRVELTKTNIKNNDMFIPVFLRKNT